MDKDLEQLVASLHRSGQRDAKAAGKGQAARTDGGARRRNATPVDKRKQFLILSAAIAFLAIGAGSLIYTSFSSAEVPASGDALATASTSDTNANAGSTGGSAANEPVYLGLSSKIRPSDYLERIAKKKGVKLELAPVSSIRLPADGHPLTLYCLLRSELDLNTLQNWKTAGMITSLGIERPFIRKVTIANQECLDNLNDWHVEAVSPTLTVVKPVADAGHPELQTPPSSETPSPAPQTESAAPPEIK